jgi:hypothetical protein
MGDMRSAVQEAIIGCQKYIRFRPFSTGKMQAVGQMEP